MGYKYERTLAPSEEVSKFAASKLGIDIEWPIWAHYLVVTLAVRKPGGGGPPVDFRDTGVVGDYIKLLIERHSRNLPTLSEKALWADSRIKDALPVPDISTYRGRFVPPRISVVGGVAGENKGRCEYYEIKPNSDTGERDGLKKMQDIDTCYRRHDLMQFYERGKVYPQKSPDYIPLGWSEVFEYLRLVFMWQNNLKECKVDLQVLRLPDLRKNPGLVLYALRIQLESDDELAKEKARAAAAGVAFAAAVCAAAGVLELVLDYAALQVAEGLMEAFETLHGPQTAAPPDTPMERVRVEPVESSGGPRVAPEQLPEEMPRIELEPEPGEGALEDVEIPRRKRAIIEGVLGRAYGIPGKSFDVYADEDYFQNVIVDPSAAQRFAGAVRVPLPQTPALIGPSALGSGYGQIFAPGFVLADLLLEQLNKRFPNQVGYRLTERMEDALRRILRLPRRSQATVVSQVLPMTAMIAAFVDPTLKESARKRVSARSPALPRGKIVLPQALLAKWSGRDANMGALPAAEKADDVVRMLLSATPHPAARRFLTDALAHPDPLKFALHAAPGFTLAIGVHALYVRPADQPLTADTMLGNIEGSIHVSRLFAVTAKPGSRPPGVYQPSDPAKNAENAAEVAGLSGSYRYLGRLRLKR
jgi:hypothetical protein